MNKKQKEELKKTLSCDKIVEFRNQFHKFIFLLKKNGDLEKLNKFGLGEWYYVYHYLRKLLKYVKNIND